MSCLLVPSVCSGRKVERMTLKMILWALALHLYIIYLASRKRRNFENTETLRLLSCAPKNRSNFSVFRFCDFLAKCVRFLWQELVILPFAKRKHSDFSAIAFFWDTETLHRPVFLTLILSMSDHCLRMSRVRRGRSEIQAVGGGGRCWGLMGGRPHMQILQLFIFILSKTPAFPWLKFRFGP